MDLAAKVAARVRALAAKGDLEKDSDVRRVPYIGKFLAAKISQAVSGTRSRATLRAIHAYLSSPPLFIGTAETVVGRLERLCQNPRANACVRRRDKFYHVRDVNKACALSLPSALLEVMGSGSALTGLRVARDRAVTRATTTLPDGTSFSPAAQCACLPEPQCRSPHCLWLQQQCVPARGARGFAGVLPFAGQLAEADRAQRGAYGPEIHGQKWRRPRRLRAVTREQQDVAWKLPGSRAAQPPEVVAAVLRHLDKTSLPRHREAIRQELGDRAPLGDAVLRALLAERPRDPLPAPLREFAAETERRRTAVQARPWWKRGIPTATRNALKQAVARHGAAARSDDELWRLVSDDPRVGGEARDERGALREHLRNYVAGLAATGGAGRRPP